MLYRRLFGLLVIASICKLGSGQCHIEPTDLNPKWLAADVLESYGHDFYQSLALGPDDVGDDQKRFVSVFSEALLLYAYNNKSYELLNVKEATQNILKQLDRPADVIGNTFRAAISLIFAIIDQPLTDEQEACPYNTPAAECKNALTKLRAERMSCCPDYEKNINLYNRLRNWANSCGLQNVLEDLTTVSVHGTDYDAIDFFVESASVKYPSTFQTFRRIFRDLISDSFSCDSFSFL